MIDYLTIALTHGLIALAAFRLMFRDDLDREQDPRAPRRKSAGNKGSSAPGESVGDA